jgi:hypothetical protein
MTQKRMAALAAALLSVLLLAGCTGPLLLALGAWSVGARAVIEAPARATPVIELFERAETLFTLEAQGGLCQYGACSVVFRVRDDATFEVRQGMQLLDLGRFEAAEIERVQALIAATDFAALRARPFTDLCPIAYDGPQFLYTFHTPQGEEHLDSCASDLPDDEPLLAAVHALYAQAADGEHTPGG